MSTKKTAQTAAEAAKIDAHGVESTPVEELHPEAENTPQEPTEAAREGEALTLDMMDELVLPGDAEEDAPASDERWRITDDGCADWALKKIKAEKDELDRITELGKQEISRITEQIERAQRRYESNTAYLTSLLAEYFETVEHKRTKAGTETYRLLHGQLVKKPATIKAEPDHEKLVKWLRENGYESLVKVEESARWGELKKQLRFVGTVATIADTGELVEGINATEQPPAFSVKV